MSEYYKNLRKQEQFEKAQLKNDPNAITYTIAASQEQKRIQAAERDKANWKTSNASSPDSSSHSYNPSGNIGDVNYDSSPSFSEVISDIFRILSPFRSSQGKPSAKRHREERVPTREEKIRSGSKTIAGIFSVGFIYLSATRLSGDPMLYAIIASTIVAPIIFFILNRPHGFLASVCVISLTFGFVGYIIYDIPQTMGKYERRQSQEKQKKAKQPKKIAPSR